MMYRSCHFQGLYSIPKAFRCKLFYKIGIILSLFVIFFSVNSASALHTDAVFDDHPNLDKTIYPVINLTTHELTFVMNRPVYPELDLSKVSIWAMAIPYNDKLSLSGASVKTDGITFTLTLQESHMAEIVSWPSLLSKLSMEKGAMADDNLVASNRVDLVINYVGSYVPPTTTPDAPSGLTASAGDKRVVLSWSAPSNDGGADVTDYTIEYRTGSAWQKYTDGENTSTSATVTGLTNGVSYEFRASASNSVGTGATSNVVSATPVTTPDAPSGLTASAGDKRVVLSWSAPSNDGGADVTDYTIEYRTGSAWQKYTDGENTSTSATVTGLTNGVSYEFRASASNSVGTGATSNVVSATPVTTPDAPSGLTASAGDKRVVLSWSAPSNDGGADVTDYTIEYRTGSAWQKYTDGENTSTSATVTGLTNGVSYEFRASASNSVGTGATSNVVSATPVTTPDAPSGLTASAGDKRVILSWSAPSNDGGADVTDYTIEYRTGSAWQKYTDGENTSTSATVTGLTNGVSYEFRASASNSVGTGATSNVVSATPVTTPDAPSGLTASAGDKRVILSWSAPSNDGGADVTDYTIEYRTGSAWQKYTDGENTSTSATVTGLTNGVSYEFRASASNSVGTGATSNVVSAMPLAPQPVKILDVPDAPSGLTASAGDKRVVLSWSAPSNDGGADVTDYTIEYRTGSAWQKYTDGENTSTSATVTGLTNGVSYEFRASASNSVGTGATSNVVSAMPLAPQPVKILDVPDAPSGLTASAGDKRVVLSWSAPSNDGGADVTDYTIEYRTGSAWQKYTDGENTSTSATVTGLTNGVSYEFRASASNSVGTGATSNVVSATPVTTPDAPSGLTASAGDKRVILSWSAPSNDGGADVTDYTIEYRTGSAWQKYTDGENTSTSATVTGLTNGVAYEFRASASNSVGTGATSNVVSAMPLAPQPVKILDVPDAPSGLTASAGDKRVVLSWSAPSNDGGADVTDYTIEYRTGSAWQKYTDGENTSTSATVTGLTNGVSYEFRASASNSVGTGATSNVVSAMPLAPQPVKILDVPDAPSGLTASAGDKRVVLSWSAPSNDGGADVTDYTIEYRTGSAWQKYTDGENTSTSATVTGLTNGVSYEFRVSASNSAGESKTCMPVFIAPSRHIDETHHEIITVGLLVSTSGSLENIGTPIAKTIHHAVEEFNKHLESENRDWRLRLLSYNDGSTSSGALAGIETFNNSGIKIVIGPASSESLSAISDYVEENDMLVISYGSTSPNLAKDDRIFRIAVSDTNFTNSLAPILQEDQIKHVIPIYRDDEWGRAMYASLSESLRPLDISLQQGVRYSTDSFDYEDIILKTKEQLTRDSTGIILLSFDEKISILDVAANENLSKVRWYGSDSNRSGLLESGVRSDFLSTVGYTILTVSVPPNDVNGKLDRIIPGSTLYTYAGYDAVFILGNAIDMIGTTFDVDSLEKIIPTVSANHNSALGNTMLNSVGDLATTNYDVWKVVDGKWELTSKRTVTLKIITFTDANGNRVMNMGESPLSGIPILLYTPDTNVADLVFSNADGIATNTNLSPNTFYAITLPPDGYIATTPSFQLGDTTYYGVIRVDDPVPGSMHEVSVGIWQDPCTLIPPGNPAAIILGCN